MLHVTAECVALFAAIHEVECYTRPMSEDEMAAMPAEARDVRGIPAMICLRPLKRIVEVYPVPDAEYDIVTETKSWSST